MAADIVPELYRKIDAALEKAMKSNKKIQNFLAKLEKGSATAQEVSLYAAEIGECASTVLGDYLKPGNLPDGKLYWNIADRTIRPVLQKAHRLVMDAAKTQQKAVDQAKGIHMQPVESRFPEERARDLIDKLVSYQEEEMEDGKVRKPIGFRYP